MSHTPGPWKAHITQNGYSINGVDCLLVTAKRDPVVLPECWEMHKANARLIAVAPELLEVCNYALKTLMGINYEPGNITISIERLAKAIAKAEEIGG